MTAQWQNPKRLVERIVIRGSLIFDSAVHLGSGDEEGLLDMTLLRDEGSGGYLLTGSTLAGGLRDYLAELDGSDYRANQLFGAVWRGSAATGEEGESVESLLMVEDAFCNSGQVEVRDGVAIDPESGAAREQQKYNVELLNAGSVFEIGVELLVKEPKNKKEEDGSWTVDALADCLKGLEKGDISFGKRKQRGFGHCHVMNWRIWRFKVCTPEGMIRWLQSWPDLGKPDGKDQPIDILLTGKELPEARFASRCVLEAKFMLKGPLMIRSTPPPEDKDGPDAVHLRSNRSGKMYPVVSGTSLAGALRGRAEFIGNVLGLDGEVLAKRVFGGETLVKRPGKKEKKSFFASRLKVDESWVEEPQTEDLMQTRLMVDRFTGGAHEGALFSEKPLFGKPATRLPLRFSLDVLDVDGRKREGDIGLLLLLLKDLWSGELPIGGESSVGRGCLQGIEGSLSYAGETWSITTDPHGCPVFGGSREILDGFLAQLRKGE